MKQKLFNGFLVRVDLDKKRQELVKEKPSIRNLVKESIKNSPLNNSETFIQFLFEVFEQDTPSSN